MSLKPLQTHFTAAESLYAPYTASGGGGGGGPAVVASTLTVSTILGGGPGQSLDFPNGFVLPVGANMELGGAPVATAAGDIDFTNNNGTITGLSTINGVAYPPAGAAASISTTTTSGGYFGSAPLNLNAAPMTVTPNKWYTAQLEITDYSFTPQPNATDNWNISVADQTGYSYLGTFNLAQLSTFKGTNNSRGFCVSGPYEAISTTANFVYTPDSNVSCSTFIVTGGRGWLSPLN